MKINLLSDNFHEDQTEKHVAARKLNSNTTQDFLLGINLRFSHDKVIEKRTYTMINCLKHMDHVVPWTKMISLG